ncbi:MAG: PEP-CTERM sorting domain-containing protein [Candidatus Auribacterota bacterium]
MKRMLCIAACVIAIISFCCIMGVNASDTKLNFTVVGTVNMADQTMNTTIPGVTGYVVWSTNISPSHPYHKIDGLVAPGYGPSNPYWLVVGMPTYLRIVFPEPVYITRIVTYNIALTTAWGTGPEAGDRWSESSLLVTSGGTDYDIGDIRVDANPAITDNADLAVNRYVTEIEYLFENITPPDYNYFAINRIEMYTPAIPEPATAALVLASIAGLVRRRLIR